MWENIYDIKFNEEDVVEVCIGQHLQSKKHQKKNRLDKNVMAAVDSPQQGN